MNNTLFKTFKLQSTYFFGQYPFLTDVSEIGEVSQINLSVLGNELHMQCVIAGHRSYEELTKGIKDAQKVQEFLALLEKMNGLPVWTNPADTAPRYRSRYYRSDRLMVLELIDFVRTPSPTPSV